MREVEVGEFRDSSGLLGGVGSRDRSEVSKDVALSQTTLRSRSRYRSDFRGFNVVLVEERGDRGWDWEIISRLVRWLR